MKKALIALTVFIASAATTAFAHMAEKHDAATMAAGRDTAAARCR